MKEKNVPGVIVPARICRAPKYMIIALTMPIRLVAERLMIEVAVKVFSTFSSKRCAPVAKTFSSRSSA